jgi:flavin reductase (DIM6/NTAB) family NADH-FMN oxidoreductase RutF
LVITSCAEAGAASAVATSAAPIKANIISKYGGGDHVIFVGRVDRLIVRDMHEAKPLLFFRGKYRRIDSEQFIQTPADADQWVHGW